jgi:GNAT superfamily N-acetyltransferase
MDAPTLQLRPALVGELDALNAVIERAVSTWDLPDRVKRLSLPLYRYDAHDLDTLDVALIESAGRRIVAVATWEPAEVADTPDGSPGLLLHGLYVDPGLARQGLGTRLLQAAEEAARVRGVAGVLVKAQRDAEGFFLSRGFEPLPVRDPDRHYPHRLWKPLDS